MLTLLGSPVALYDGDPHVATVHSFTDIGPQGSSFVALEFFAGWCGHCQEFAPLWKAAAKTACAAAPALQFAAVDCVSDYILCQEMAVPSFPTIRLYGPGLPAKGRELSDCPHGCDTSSAVLNEVLRLVRRAAPAASFWHRDPGRPTTASELALRSGQHACSQAAAGQAVSVSVRGSGLRQGEAPPAASQMPVPMADLVSAALYGMQRELLRLPLEAEGELAGDQPRRAAFFAWLSTLAALFPGASNRDALRRLARQAAALPRLDAKAWHGLLRESDGPLLPQGAVAGGIAWAACRGWSDEARGYPCGLWLLFHTLLAQASDAQAGAALRAIRGFVRHFFGCDACRAHFLSLTEAAEDPLDAAARSADAAVLWLWRAHNRVNYRLNQSGADAVLQLGLLKPQFPSVARCPACRGPSGRWREASLLRHLRASYCLEPRPGSPCEHGPVDVASPASARGGLAGVRGGRVDEDAEETELPLPAVAAAAALAAALAALCGCRRGRAESCEPKVLKPVNHYSAHWDGERVGSGTTLPLLQR